jgi:hypothetical protein
LATFTNDRFPVVAPSGEAKPLRQQMPLITAFYDDLRAAFGEEEVNSWIKQGLRDGTFWAIENGVSVWRRPVR